MQTMDRSLWERLNPLLDELLDLEPAPRAQRLATLRGQDPDVARQLAEMLERLEALEHDTFLQRSPSLPELSLPEPGMAGQTLGAYTIVRELGRGGMGSVWLAQRTDGRYEGNVAVKFLAGGAALRGSAERFAREGSILARLAHPNIARLIDAGVTAEGQRYLVLEYIDGEAIDRYVDRLGLDVTARVRLFIDVLAAVAHAHNRLILHRDIKPANILVTGSGEVKLLDFGIAKLLDDGAVPAEATELTQLAGRAYTPAYAAPEQVEDGDVTTATDVYALGVLLYGLLGGGHPTAVPGTTPLEQLRAVVEAEPRRLSEAVGRQGSGSAGGVKRARELRGDLDNIVAKALKKVPAERYANAQQLADDLRRYLSHEPVAARADAPGYLLGKFVRRHQAGVAAGVVVVVALVVGIGVALWEASEARRQRLQAEGLIEFMLGDLRKKLQPVGRLDVLDAVGEKVLGYYAAQDVGRLDADSLGRRARALHLIGEMAEKRGKLDEAQRIFQQAAESTEELVARYPQDVFRLYDHSQSAYWVGYAALRRGKFSEAESSFLLYLKLTKELVRLDPNNLDWNIERAHANGNLGVINLRMGRVDLSLAALTETRDAWLSLVKLQADLGYELANTMGWIASAYEAKGRYDLAIEAQLAKRASLSQIPNAAGNRNLQNLLANSRYEIGRMYFLLGRYEVAANAMREAVEQLDTLALFDKSNEDWNLQAVVAHLDLAEILISLGRLVMARGHVEQAIDKAIPWLSKNIEPSRLYVGVVGRAVILRARLPGLPQFKVPDLGEFIALTKRAEASGLRLDSIQLRILSDAELLLGDGVADTAPALAREHWQSVVTRLLAVDLKEDPSIMTLIAQAHLRLGNKTEAHALTSKVESSLFRHPALADLRKRLVRAAGVRTE